MLLLSSHNEIYLTRPNLCYLSVNAFVSEIEKVRFMAIFKFFKLNKPQPFGFKPRYWDEEKEDLESRLRKWQDTGTESPEAVKRRIASGLKKRYSSSSFGNRDFVRRSNLLLILVLAGLLLLAYLFLTESLPKLLEWLYPGQSPR